MSVRSEPHIKRVHQPHTHAANERCPLCKQVLPQEVTQEELEEELRKKERQAAKAQEQTLRAQLTQEMNVRVESAAKEAKQEALKEAAKREAQIRIEVEAKAQEGLKESIAKADSDKELALAQKKAADEQLTKMKTEQEAQKTQAVQKALQDQREALEEDKTKAVHSVEARNFDEKQKLQKTIEQLKRQVEQKSNTELGEGAEIDLFEALREQFEGDDIKRIKKGQPGADILHKIIHNGQECGAIIYDSKNHRQWRNSFAEKLKTDQLAAKADHAILASSAFPAGAQQLHVTNEVIVLNPARAVDMVGIIREHVIRTHRLRLSVDEREKKTEALYEFINSERCRQLMARYDVITGELLELDVKEKKAHDTTWNKRGQLVRDVQKVHGDYTAEIDRIIEDGGGA